MSSFKQFLEEKNLAIHVKKGGFHAWLGKSPDEPITAADIAKGKAAGGHAEKMAIFAQNFGHVGEEVLDEASPVTGTRMVSRHGVVGSAHHAEVRYNKDYEEYSVHHYAHGKHMGEGPVSYHGNDKEDAKNTAEHEVKRHAVKENVQESSDEILTHTKRHTDLDAWKTDAARHGYVVHNDTIFKDHYVAHVKGEKPYGKHSRGSFNTTLQKGVVHSIKEDTINELSKKTLGSYINKSANEVHSAGWAQGKAKSIYAHDRSTKWADKRKNGIETATKKLTKEETTVNEKITDSKEQLERAIAAAERKAQAAPSSQTSSYVEALKKALRRIKGRKNIRADEVGLKAEETEKHEPNHKEHGKGKRAARFKFKKKYDKQNEGTEYFTEELGPEHHAALHRYATKHGRTWKNKLNTDWEKGHTHGDDTAALRQVRNNIGPSGLMKYKLDPSRDDHPNNAWKTRIHSKGEHDVKEEVQPLSELSKKVLKSYREKALNQLKSGSGPLNGKEEKRFNGVAKSVKEEIDEGLFELIYEADQAFHTQDEFLNHAQSRGHKIKTILRGANAHLHAKDPSSGKTHGLFDVKKEHGVYSTMPIHVGEGVETIDELSRTTLASYVRNAASDMGDRQVDHMRSKHGSEEANKHLHKFSKRYRGILRATNHKRLAKEETITEEMSDAAHELVLHADYDAHLHHSSHQPIISNLKKKAKKGSYDPEKAKKLWKYHADRAAQSYHKQHGDKHTAWHHMFTTHDRHQAAAHWEAHHRDEVHE
jgi:hypothetical protein